MLSVDLKKCKVFAKAIQIDNGGVDTFVNDYLEPNGFALVDIQYGTNYTAMVVYVEYKEVNDGHKNQND